MLAHFYYVKHGFIILARIRYDTNGIHREDYDDE